MKTTEIRIGNFVDILDRQHEVHLPSGLVKVVGHIGLFSVGLYKSLNPIHSQKDTIAVDINDISPIPITWPWLKKFGFERREHLKDAFIRINQMGCILIWQKDSTRMCNPNEYAVHVKPVKYVHELQNLYFTLTGEELK